MIRTPELLRPSEAAVVSEVDLRDVNHAIDRGILPSDAVARSPRRGLSAAACLYLRFYHGSAESLTADARIVAIAETSRRLEGRKIETAWAFAVTDWVIRHAFLRIDIEPFVVSTSERWNRYREAKAAVERSPDTLGGTPVLRGTRIPVHDVAASVAAGHPVERILSAYPRLDAERIELAVLYAKANPLRGRPRVAPTLAGAGLVSEERVPRRKAG